MKLTRIIPVAFAAVSILLSSCSEEATPKTYFDIYSQELPFDGGTADVTVYSNGSWEVTSVSDDLTVSPTSGYGDTKITATVPANDQITTKSFHFSIKTTIGTAYRTSKTVFTVGAQPFVVCEEDSLEVPAEGGKVWFTVNSNYPWEVSSITASAGGTEGVTVDPSEWDRNTTSVEVFVPANTSGVVRTLFIELKIADYPDRNEILIVNQPA